MKKLFIFLTVSLLVIACTKVPLTGRRQLSLVPQSELIPMSFQQYRQIMDSVKLSNDADQVAMVKRVGGRIETAVGAFLDERGFSKRIDGFEWEFNLIDNDTTVNAWAMPGGKVAFYTGILPICQDEAGVAVVMGHEVAHAVANHGGERMSQQLALYLGFNTLSAAMGANPTLTEQIFLQSIGIGSQLGMLKFSRTHESEADKLGLMFMAIAGYDPREASRFWERMRSDSGRQPPEWLSTHPSHDTRIEDLNEALPEALEYYNKSQN